MYSFYIEGNDVKIFMNKLLKDDFFNSFELRLCKIKKNIFITIDGKLNKNWYDEDNMPENTYSSWAETRPYIFELIKGKRVPEYMNLILSIKGSALEGIHKNAKACFLNITFEDGKIAVITGTAQREFSFDKSLDDAWEENVKKFFKKMGVVQNKN